MTLPRLLNAITAAPMTHERHLSVHGELPAPSSRAAIDEIERSGLRGRGGGAFPLARKLATVRRGRGRPLVVVNGCESEPMSAKDRVLLGALPHLVIDGALHAARAVGAREIVVAIDELNVRGGETIEWALAQRPELESGSVTASVAWTPSGYVSGQETAIVRWCNDGVAKPWSERRRVAERGIARRPTLVSNAETLAHVALIARHGADWFAQLGTDEDPGSALITLGGGVRAPGVYEIEHGAGLQEFLDLVGGCVGRPRAFLLGGYAGGWIDGADASQVRLARRDLQRVRARLGSGVVVALPESACPVAETARVAGWLSEHSSGQCGPCVNGLGAIAGELERICDGSAGRGALADVLRWCGLSSGRGACAHPDGAAGFVVSALHVFASEFRDHARNGSCEACDRAPVLTVPGRRSPVA